MEQQKEKNRDPFPGRLGNPQTLNPYIYCLNNPLKYIDPNGQRPLDWEEEDWWGKDYGDEEDYSDDEEESDSDSKPRSKYRYSEEDQTKVYYMWGGHVDTKITFEIYASFEITIDCYIVGRPGIPISLTPISYKIKVIREYYHKYKVYERDGKIIKIEYVGIEARFIKRTFVSKWPWPPGLWDSEEEWRV